ncbi:efflux RND transporter periplasmic adaptor subunit [Clostridium sp. DJ247]|uniref:efflux RND transporter periplasmic adaptor subunit n=1 Tax=Clostridium sp. DJ247 TaxID=2726188 RepID=UPI001629E831|nr:efflux RND transporter periplasmic adaptor subunit [Clostridium sp. DJ247]MBC2580760.1 efflux RND transporter periplasmic adaptor subunit [Clostridium sp. DJ247]
MKVKKLDKKWIFLIIIVAVIGIAVAKYEKKPVDQVKKEIPNVKVQKIDTQNISSEVQYASKLEGVQSVTVSPKSPGKVAAVNVKVGDKVSAGQVLFTLDTSELYAQLQQQQAALNASSANLSRTSGTSLTQAIQNSEQQVAKDQIAYNDAKDNYDKMQQLYNVGAVAKQDLDNAKSKFDTASLQLKSNQDNLNLQKEQIGPQSVQAAAAQVEQSEAAVNYVRTQINNSTITSPIAGVVSAKNVEVGEITSGTTGTITIIDTSSLIAQVTVPDRIIGKLQVGQTVPVAVNALSDKTITGVIDNISPDADSKNNSYTVKVKIDNSNGELKAGMFAKISIPDQKKDNAVVVPNEAIKVENGVKYIYTVESNKIKRVVVETGIANDKITEVAGNVKVGTEIITEGQSLLNDGDKVNVVK